MKSLMFQGTVQVELQGESALKFIARLDDHAEYQVIGYEDKNIILYDYREASLQALDNVLRTGQYELFAVNFNHPAEANIWEIDFKRLEIYLYDTDNITPSSMLWIAIGIENAIPVYDYLFYELTPINKEQYAFLSLYRRPRVQANHWSALPVYSP
jgi:hypothetical protein